MITDFDRDDPNTWATAELHSLPDFPVEAYQKKLDKIFPRTIDGYPIVRLVYAPDIKKCYSRFYCEWSPITGLGTQSELRAKYRYAVVKIPGTKDIIDVPPPRWLIEERHEPGQYAHSWDQARWVNGKEMRPPFPTEGYYSELITIASHDNKCCKLAKKDKVVCWGKYRLPDDHDLNILREAKFKRDKDAFVNVNAPLDQKTLDILGREASSRVQNNEAEVDRQIEAFVDANALELIEMCSGQKLSHKTKKFSFAKGVGAIPLN